MQENKNRKGLALGVVATLVSSLFGAVPAAYSSETAVVITATGDGAQTQNSMLHTEAFETFLRFGTGVATRTANFGISYTIDSSSAAVIIFNDDNGNYASGASDVTASSYSATTANDGYATFTSLSPYVRFSVPGLTSVSPAVAITVTPYMELDSQNGLTAGDAAGTAYTINFVPWSVMAPALTLQQPVAFDRGITASVTVTAGTLRWSQIDGWFTVALDSTAEQTTAASGTNSASVGGSDVELTGAELQTANFSFSATAATAPFTTSPEVQSVSAQLWYVASDPANTTNLTDHTRAFAMSKLGVTARTITGVTISPVAGSNAEQTGTNGADIRINSEVTVRAYAHSTAQTVSMAVQSVVSVSAQSGLDLDADSGVILGGVTHTSSATLLKAAVTLSAGTTTFTLSTFGQSSGTKTLDLIVTSQGVVSTAFQFNVKVATFAVVYTPTAVAGSAGAAKTFTVDVEDSFGAVSARTDQRVQASVLLSGSTSDTVSASVVAGKATLTVAPVPSTRTGSGVVTFTLQTFNQDTQAWETNARDTATWNVYATADSFVSRTASVSSSISYGVAYSWSGTVAIRVTNSNSDVVVSAPGLIIQNADDTTKTASGTLTITAGGASGQAVNVKFAGAKTGTVTVTFTNGTASTTSLVVFDAAPSDKGTTITWDTTVIESGKTRVITGTVKDANGNPVDTTRAGETAGDSGTASILVTYLGTAGIVAGTMPTETDANGNFKLSVLTAAADSGTMTLTAVYMPQGASTVAADKVTSVQAVNVTPATAPEVNAVIGSFNGRWAVRVENAKGSVVSVKAGSRWVKFTSLNNNYLFSRKSVVGRTLAVSVWVDGELQNSQTITIK